MWATTHSKEVFDKLWNYCNLLRDDGLTYGDHVEQLTYLLSFKNRNYLVSQGSGRNVHYVLGQSAGLGTVQERPDGDHLAPECTHLVPEGDHLPSSTTHLPLEDDHLPPEGDHLDSSVRYLHQETLLRIVASLRSTRKAPSREEMRETILRLCAIEPLSTKQLKALSQRAQPTIRRYVQELEQEGRIAKADPIPGVRFARYVTVSIGVALQKRLDIPEAE